jgi:hypothetical protein
LNKITLTDLPTTKKARQIVFAHCFLQNSEEQKQVINSKKKVGLATEHYEARYLNEMVDVALHAQRIPYNIENS